MRAGRYGQVGPLPGAGQASQQLAQVPGVPFFAVHDAASFLILQLVTPCGFVTQQVTNPGLPHVECAAHFLTAPLHVFGKKLGSAGSRPERVFATPAAQLTYCPWFTVGGLPASHVQSVATCCLAANVFDPSGSSFAQFAKATGALTSRSDTPRTATAMDLMWTSFSLSESSSARAQAMVKRLMWGADEGRIKGGNLLAYCEDQLRLAVHRSVAIETSRGWRIAKDKASHRIDLVVALAQAASRGDEGRPGNQ